MQRENDMLRNKAGWFDLSIFFTGSHVLQIGDMVMWRDTPNLQHCLAETFSKENDWTWGTTQLYCTLDFTNSSPTWDRLIVTRHRHSMCQCATNVVSMWHPIIRQLIAASRRFKSFPQVSKRSCQLCAVACLERALGRTMIAFNTMQNASFPNPCAVHGCTAAFGGKRRCWDSKGLVQ